MCQHRFPCPTAEATDHAAAQVVSCHLEQGWSLLCNGVVLFADTGELLPDGSAVAPQRSGDRAYGAAAVTSISTSWSGKPSWATPSRVLAEVNAAAMGDSRSRAQTAERSTRSAETT
jgi:hypothetical protein